MLKCKVIGVGAAGNKAVIEAVEKGVITTNDILLLNSTMKDIPSKYNNVAMLLSDDIEGCGKEREVGKEIGREWLEANRNKLGSLIGDSDFTMVVTSSEGGTGCGASVEIAKVISEADIPVFMTIFTGFEEDARGLQNTLELFNDMSDSYTIQVISNKKFLVNNNKLKAEKDANLEFANNLAILIGSPIRDSEQNIDDTDLSKIVDNPGYTVVEYKEVDNIKNVEQFNQIIKDMIDNSKSLDTTPTCTRMGVILNISDKSKAFIDYEFNQLKEYYGNPYELFTHVQYDESLPEFIAFIVSGLKMPKDEIQKILGKFNELSNNISDDNDSFFDNKLEIKGKNKFNNGRRRRKRISGSNPFLKENLEKPSIALKEEDKDVLGFTPNPIGKKNN